MKADVQIQQDVITELNWEPAIDASQIGVEVSGGIVTLAGHVDSFAQKWAAERAAQRVSGVKALAVEMDVNLPGSDTRNDADIARTAQNVLEWITYLPKGAVSVMVEGGWVTLSGELAWEYQKQAAAQAVHHLMGVTGLSNQIAIRPRESLGARQDEIEAAINRLDRGAHRVSVEVRDDEVILTGSVRSWAERDSVRQSVWGAPGVRNIDDQMIYAY
jgi:osmotically-inducible protein OsmY